MRIAPIQPAVTRVYAVNAARDLEAVRPVREAPRVGGSEARGVTPDEQRPAAVLHWSETATALARAGLTAPSRGGLTTPSRGAVGDEAEGATADEADAATGGEDAAASDDAGTANGADAEATGRARAGGPSEPTPEERQQIDELKQRDREVRTHEQAHKAAGGAHAGSIRLQYTTGPDGKRYASSGEVSIDVAPVKGDPEATLRKMEVVQRAANAPAEPSGADRQVAARAASTAQRARAELAAERYGESQKLGEEAGAGQSGPARAGAEDPSPAAAAPDTSDSMGTRRAPTRIDVRA